MSQENDFIFFSLYFNIINISFKIFYYQLYWPFIVVNVDWYPKWYYHFIILTTIPFGTNKHSFPFKISKYWFTLTIYSGPRINKASVPPIYWIRFIMFIDLPLMYINPPLLQNKQLVCLIHFISRRSISSPQCFLEKCLQNFAYI